MGLELHAVYAPVILSPWEYYSVLLEWETTRPQKFSGCIVENIFDLDRD
jgi:hypothetical protein